MFSAVCMMNYSNHNAALRIATRTEATTIGNRVLDSLQTLGVERVVATASSSPIPYLGDTTKSFGTGKPRTYNVTVAVDTLLSSEGTIAVPVNHIRAKKVDISVAWKLGARTNSITINGVVE